MIIVKERASVLANPVSQPHSGLGVQNLSTTITADHRRAAVLDAIEPDPVALVHPLDLAALGGRPGDVITLASRRGEVTLYARADESSPRGAIFVPFCYYEAAINKLTNAALDPFAKIPEFKYCAIKATLGGSAPRHAARVPVL